MDERDQLRNFIAAVYPLPLMDMEAFLSIWEPFQAKRKTLLSREGEKERHLYFVIEGIQRVFYTGDDERDATIVFTYPPSFSGVADSFLTQTSSRFSCETLTPSSFLKTDFNQLDGLMKVHHEIERMIRILTNHAFSGVLHRIVETQCFTAEEKFRSLFARSPHLLNLVPHKYIASYLGVDATNFSKMLAKIRI
ncbi:MAG TPA: cyclic nucleotide-binding domain-containing protein [Ferruginibacter sp.]|nr:cyclic nucleotide-binding domain-containing protein [Ferruginibacter sp.]